MTTSPPSSSSPRGGFARLHPGVQKWVYGKGWEELHPIQEQAIAAILGGDPDVVITAATAGGKTEAAFLPLCSRIATAPGSSLRVLCISPLKALINDQFDRLELLCESAGIPIHRWHGDVAAGAKARALKDPAGLLLITPESLEALFVRRSSQVPAFFADLDYVVVDELHAFIGTERGAQLRSLLNRVELAARRRVPRVGLSATIGDVGLACEFLRPGGGERVVHIADDGASDAIMLQLRGYLTPSEPPAVVSGGEEAEAPDGGPGGDALAIAEHLFAKLRGADNLVFANRRQEVETYTDRLRRLTERARVPNEFYPHHGSLAKDLREEAEARLKDKRAPATVICTSTLELGIDVGDVKSVAQLGPPPSVASLRQRLGRSGRRGEPAIMRIYIQENAIDVRTPPPDALRVGLVQATAMVELLLARWCEPPSAGALHLSTLVQQILSVIAQHGGARAPELWRALCQAGSFRSVDQATFAGLLRGMGAHDLIIQDGDGTLVLGLAGERIVNHYGFYAAFATPVEWRLVAQGRPLGTVPIEYAVSEGLYLIFGGRRWRVVGVDEERKVVDLVPAPGGKAPRFAGHGAIVHARVRARMRALYAEASTPAYLDAGAVGLLGEARAQFGRLGLAERALVAWGRDTHIFPWLGDRALDALGLALQSVGLAIAREDVSLAALGATPGDVQAAVRRLQADGMPPAAALARLVRTKEREKYHPYLPAALLEADYAATSLDVEGAAGVLGVIADGTA